MGQRNAHFKELGKVDKPWFEGNMFCKNINLVL